MKRPKKRLSEDSSGRPLGDSFDDPAELYFGLVGPTGVDLDLVCDLLAAELRLMQYETYTISLSELIYRYLGTTPESKNNYKRISELMDMGTFLKGETNQPDIVARLGLNAIAVRRRIAKGKGVLRRAYIIRSLKNPSEVELFRDVYAEHFFLVSVYASKLARIDFLKRHIGATWRDKELTAEDCARQLIRRDYDESEVLNGQQVGKTFPLADFFVNAESRRDLEDQLQRLVRLAFGYPYLSPTKEEEAMFIAQAAALRSLDLSRQVGSSIVTDDGVVLATGCNEVPKAGGGFYWADCDKPQRDFEVGFDSNELLKRQVLEDVLSRLLKAEWLVPKLGDLPLATLVRDALASPQPGPPSKDMPRLKDSPYSDVIEFGRAVHAEMAAITSAARHNGTLAGARLFCTTFPCHLCARHIVAAGIKEVFFIEPYEKSRVQQLYDDSIVVEPGHGAHGTKTAFRAFVGAAPRRYIEFFQVRGRRKGPDGRVLDAEGMSGYKVWKKKAFFVYMLENLLILETKQAPKYGRKTS